MASVIALTGEQIRAGRALARIEQTTLAEASGLSLETIKRVERIRGPVNVNLKTLNALTAAFQGLGIVFDSQGGLRTTYGADPQSVREEPELALERLIYVSKATGKDQAPEAVLRSIVAVSSRRNALLGVTGVLLAFRGQYLQVLEGPSENLDLLYRAISADRRHTEVRTLERAPVELRSFGNWTMRAGVIALHDEGLFQEIRALEQPSEELPVAAVSELLLLVRNMDPRLAARI
jgi:transcriptional regulator with XRE-family HTH domain